MSQNEQNFELLEIPEDMLNIDMSTLTLPGYEVLKKRAEMIQARYKNMVIGTPEQAKSIKSRGNRDSVVSRLNKISKVINRTRIDYEKTIKEQSAKPANQLKEIKAIIDGVVDNLNEAVGAFNDKQKEVREKRLKEMYEKVKNDFAENNALNQEFLALYDYNIFFKGKFLSESNKVSTNKDKWLENFISDYLNKTTNAINHLQTTAIGFEKDGITLNKSIVNKKIFDMIKENIAENDEGVDDNVVNSKFTDWLINQKRALEENIMAQQQAELARKHQLEQQEKLKKQQEELARNEQQKKQLAEENKGVDENGGIEINEQPENEVVKEAKAFYVVTVEASKTDLSKIREFMTENNIKFEIDEIK